MTDETRKRGDALERAVFNGDRPELLTTGHRSGASESDSRGSSDSATASVPHASPAEWEFKERTSLHPEVWVGWYRCDQETASALVHGDNYRVRPLYTEPTPDSAADEEEVFVMSRAEVMSEVAEELGERATEIRALREALEPFAKFACDPPNDCHNCRARTALDLAKGERKNA